MDSMSVAPYSTIIKFLEKYREEIDIDLLAKLLKRDEGEIKDYLLTLQEDGVVNLQDSKVRLEEHTTAGKDTRSR